jgi:precorrin-2/cobalt-factor-2 C20-methyltransferase
MKNSYRFFENKECEYYPCHENIETMNCMFCYCAMYRFEKCLGTPEFKEKNGKKIKVCKNCVYPHIPENYDNIIKFLINDGKTE